jgi:hypothetical protein
MLNTFIFISFYRKVKYKSDLHLFVGYLRFFLSTFIFFCGFAFKYLFIVQLLLILAAIVLILIIIVILLLHFADRTSV